MKSLKIRQANPNDAERICEIYNWYVLNTIITFELEPISSFEMSERIAQKLEKYDWLIGELNQEIVGYAYAGSFRARAAYDHSSELSVYLDHTKTGQGFGVILYQAIIDRCRELGFKELIGGAALPNEASVKLHEQLGFQKIGVFPRVGFKFGSYIDVGFWQLSL
jgi:L-amino acid N-acyltransferase YncA